MGGAYAVYGRGDKYTEDFGGVTRIRTIRLGGGQY